MNRGTHLAVLATTAGLVILMLDTPQSPATGAVASPTKVAVMGKHSGSLTACEQNAINACHSQAQKHLHQCSCGRIRQCRSCRSP